MLQRAVVGQLGGRKKQAIFSKTAINLKCLSKTCSILFTDLRTVRSLLFFLKGGGCCDAVYVVEIYRRLGTILEIGTLLSFKT